MSETLTYVPIICSKPVNVIDDKIQLLVNADVDCFVNEKREIVVHPDQWEKACKVLDINL